MFCAQVKVTCLATQTRFDVERGKFYCYWRH